MADKKYEFEETKQDDIAALSGVAGLALLGLGGLLFSSSKTKKENIQREIERKQDQYNALNAKWFKSSAEKAELARLEKDIAELKRKL